MARSIENPEDDGTRNDHRLISVIALTGTVLLLAVAIGEGWLESLVRYMGLL